GASVGRAAPGDAGSGNGGVRVWSVYVPNGRALGDPHYDYKLAWLGALADAAREWAGEPTLLVGDWNVAPLDEDVWDIEVFAGAPPPSARTGVTSRWRAAATTGCGSISRSPRPPLPSGSAGCGSTGMNAKGKAPPITCPSSSTSRRQRTDDAGPRRHRAGAQR